MNPTAPFDYGVERLRAADRFRSVAQTAPPSYVEAIHEGVIMDRLSVECVLDGTYLDDLRDAPDMEKRWNEIAAQSGAVWRFKEPLGFVLLVLDNTVHFWLCDEGGEPQGLVESTDPDILSLANATVERYLERSKLIDSVVAEGSS